MPTGETLGPEGNGATGTFAGGATFGGTIIANGGTNSAGASAVSSETLTNAAAGNQLSQTTKNAIVVITITLAGTAFSVKIGSTSTPTGTVIPSSTVVAGQTQTFLVPAGWYVAAVGTTATWTATATTF